MHTRDHSQKQHAQHADMTWNIPWACFWCPRAPFFHAFQVGFLGPPNTPWKPWKAWKWWKRPAGDRSLGRCSGGGPTKSRCCQVRQAPPKQQQPGPKSGSLIHVVLMQNRGIGSAGVALMFGLSPGPRQNRNTANRRRRAQDPTTTTTTTTRRRAQPRPDDDDA